MLCFKGSIARPKEMEMKDDNRRATPLVNYNNRK